MGDITGIVDASGNLVAEYEYDPWGAVVSVTGSNTALANANPFRYRSYYYDSDTGMYYLQSRYYDPEICRFINADRANYLENTKNLFLYCSNNPILFLDRNGFEKTYVFNNSFQEILYFVISIAVLYYIGINEEEINTLVSSISNVGDLYYVVEVIANGYRCSIDSDYLSFQKNRLNFLNRIYGNNPSFFKNILIYTNIPVNIAFTNKDVCLIVAKYYLWVDNGAYDVEYLAKEFYGHAMIYYKFNCIFILHI